MEIKQGLTGFSNELFRKTLKRGLTHPEFANDIKHIDHLIEDWVKQNQFEEIVMNDNTLATARQRYTKEDLELLHHYTAAKILNVVLFKMLKDF